MKTALLTRITAIGLAMSCINALADDTVATGSGWFIDDDGTRLLVNSEAVYGENGALFSETRYLTVEGEEACSAKSESIFDIGGQEMQRIIYTLEPDSSWKKVSTTLFSYNSKHFVSEKMTTDTSGVIISGQLIDNYGKVIADYDANAGGFVISDLYDKNAPLSTEVAFYNEDRTISNTETYLWTDKESVGFLSKAIDKKTAFTYDAETHKLVEEKTSTWDEVKRKWIVTKTVEYAYYEDGKTKSRIISEPTIENELPYYTGLLTQQYYDEEGRMIREGYLAWDKSSGYLTAIDCKGLTYDENGYQNSTSDYSYSYELDDWITCDETLQELDENGRVLTEEVRKWLPEKKKPFAKKLTTNSYDNDGHLIATDESIVTENNPDGSILSTQQIKSVRSAYHCDSLIYMLHLDLTDPENPDTVSYYNTVFDEQGRVSQVIDINCKQTWHEGSYFYELQLYYSYPSEDTVLISSKLREEENGFLFDAYEITELFDEKGRKTAHFCDTHDPNPETNHITPTTPYWYKYYEYGESEQKTKITEELYDYETHGTEPIEVSMKAFEYDDRGNKTRYIEKYCDDSDLIAMGEFKQTLKNEGYSYVYDENDSLSAMIKFVYRNNTIVDHDSIYITMYYDVFAKKYVGIIEDNYKVYKDGSSEYISVTYPQVHYDEQGEVIGWLREGSVEYRPNSFTGPNELTDNWFYSFKSHNILTKTTQRTLPYHPIIFECSYEKDGSIVNVKDYNYRKEDVLLKLNDRFDDPEFGIMTAYGMEYIFSYNTKKWSAPSDGYAFLNDESGVAWMTYGYDDKGNFVGSEKEKIKKDENCNEVLRISYLWDDTINDWFGITKQEKKYNNENRIEERRDYVWDATAKGWLQTTEMKYNKQDNPSSLRSNSSNRVTVIGGEGQILVLDETADVMRVLTMGGTMVYCDKAQTISIGRGFYIVNIGGKTSSVIVK